MADVYYAFDSTNADSATEVTTKTVFDEKEIENLYDTELYGLTKMSRARRMTTSETSTDGTNEINFPKRFDSSVILDNSTIGKKSFVKFA